MRPLWFRLVRVRQGQGVTVPSPDSPFLFQAGPLSVRWYSVLLVGAILAGTFVVRLEARRSKDDLAHIGDLLLWCIIFGVAGARLYHILSSPAGASRGFHYYFVGHPFANLTLFGIAVPFPTALFIWEGGIGVLGALVGGIIAIAIYARRQNLDVWHWLDMIALGLLPGQAIGRWGNFFNQELYGLPTRLPWGITITNVNQRLSPYDDLTQYPLDTLFHPVFLYESIWHLLGFAVFFWVSRRYGARLPAGNLFAFILVWYGIGRFFIEALRPDAWLVGGMAVAQIISVGLILIGGGLIAVWRNVARDNI